jgi:chemotaxis protein MotB
VSSLEEKAPIIIKRKKGGHAAHHGGAWKVAYADFVTAMMALFMVLWIVGQSKQVKEYVAQYFKDPGAFHEMTKRGSGVLEGAASLPKPELKEEFLKREAQKLEQMGKEIMQELRKNPKLEGLSKQIQIEIVKEGLRIELVETSESFFFDIGTANLKPDAKGVLTVIAKELSKLPNRIVFEGHTDSRQYSTENGYTNFELSSDRANSARRMLVNEGVRYSQIDEVRGYGDTRLRNAKDPLDASNRRISLLVKFEEKSEHE